MTHVLVSGATGYLGSYACIEALRDPGVHLDLLVRARTRREAAERLWQGWQLHLDADAFAALLPRITFRSGDLHAPGLGLSTHDRDALVERSDSILHVAASLNRKSEKACLNTNLRGALSVIALARTLRDHGRLRRFSFVSTVAVAGERAHEDLGEDDVIDWGRSDYDPYARTKKFGEHMVRTLLPDVDTLVFRPSTVMGDPTHPRTTQFDMLRATFGLAELPVLPLAPDGRVDIVDARFVGGAMARIHLLPKPRWDTYHLSSGRESPTPRTMIDALAPALRRRPTFAPRLEPAFDLGFRAMNRAPRGSAVAAIGALMKVFWPYITYDTVFLNDRAIADSGLRPTRFEAYCEPLYRWCTANRYRYPEVPLPEGLA